MKKLILAAAALSLAHTAFAASAFSVAGSGDNFVVTRSGDGTNTAETVLYRTVGLSACDGQHFTAKSGTLDFAPGQTTTNVVVTETSPTADAYSFQTGPTRTYRFELTDAGGFYLNEKSRTVTTGTQLSSSYLNSAVTNLVYFDNDGAIKSGAGNRYLDVALPNNTSYVQVTDGGYKQAVHTIPTDGLFGNSAAVRTYLRSLGCRMCATVYFTQKEEDDGYQYIQILADNSSTYDGDDGDGKVNAPSLSLYKSCFILSYTPSGSVMTSDHHQFFPHRYDYVDKAAETTAGISQYEFDYGNSHLYQQKFRDNAFRSDSSGSLVLPLTVNSLNVRFDAAGSGGDTWDFKDLKARLAIIDIAAPTVLAVSAAPGIHAKGNDIYVSVAFSEPVAVTGTPTLSTSWGTLNYTSGSGSNVLTFKGTIPATAIGSLNVTGKNGNIKDLAGNALSGGITASNLASLSPSHAYTITYDLAGGTLPAANPATYTYESAAFTLANPTRTGYNFAGWTGSNGATPQTSVTIAAQSHGDRAYTANWTPVTYFVHFDANGGTGSMPDQTLAYDTPQALTSNAFTSTGYTFAGWRGADGAIHPDRATVLNLTNAQDAVVSLTAQWRPNIPYIDEDGTEQICTDYTVLTDATSGVTYGEFGATAWYVVTNAVTISGNLWFCATTAHLILCDGATLAVTNANGYAIRAGNLTIYGQTNGTGAVTATANGSNDHGIYANGGSVTINGGTVTAESGPGGIGICAPAPQGSIILGWTNPTDSITASSYYAGSGSVRVKTDQWLTDGSNIYGSGYDLNLYAIAGVTLRPAYSITLPEGVVAGGVVRQNGTTAYAIAGTSPRASSRAASSGRTARPPTRSPAPTSR